MPDDDLTPEPPPERHPLARPDRGRVEQHLIDDEKRQRRAFLKKRRDRVGHVDVEVQRHDERGVPSEKRPY